MTDTALARILTISICKSMFEKDNSMSSGYRASCAVALATASEVGGGCINLTAGEWLSAGPVLAQGERDFLINTTLRG